MSEDGTTGDDGSGEATGNGAGACGFWLAAWVVSEIGLSLLANVVGERGYVWLAVSALLVGIVFLMVFACVRALRGGDL